MPANSRHVCRQQWCIGQFTAFIVGRRSESGGVSLLHPVYFLHLVYVLDAIGRGWPAPCRCSAYLLSPTPARKRCGQTCWMHNTFNDSSNSSNFLKAACHRQMSPRLFPMLPLSLLATPPPT